MPRRRYWKKSCARKKLQTDVTEEIGLDKNNKTSDDIDLTEETGLGKNSKTSNDIRMTEDPGLVKNRFQEDLEVPVLTKNRKTKEIVQRDCHRDCLNEFVQRDYDTDLLEDHSHVSHDECTKKSLSGCIQNSLVQNTTFVFGSFHQGSNKFSSFSKGSQCTCNALTMLVKCYEGLLSFTKEFLDNTLIGGDQLYITVVKDLQQSGRFVSKLLMFDDLPGNLTVGENHHALQKFESIWGLVISVEEDSQVLNLHEAIQQAFQVSRYTLIMLGAICSAVYKMSDTEYYFFDSHSHGTDGMSTFDGKSVLVLCRNIDDLVHFMYNMYNSLHIDFSTQFEILPVSFQTLNHSFPETDPNLQRFYRMDQDFSVSSASKKDLHLRNITKGKTKDNNRESRHNIQIQTDDCGFHSLDHDNTSQMERDVLTQSIESNRRELKKENRKIHVTGAETSERRRLYMKKYMQSRRQSQEFRTAEKQTDLLSRHKARKDVQYRQIEQQKERANKRKAREDIDYKEKERTSKRIVREDVRYRQIEQQKEKANKRKARKDDQYRQTEQQKERANKRKAREDIDYKEKERTSKRIVREDVRYRQIEQQKEKAYKRKARKDDQYRQTEQQKERANKRKAREDIDYKEKERTSKRLARKDVQYRRDERKRQLLSKDKARKDASFRAKELRSKRLARKSPLFAERERLKKLESRKNILRRDFERNVDKTRKAQKRKTAQGVEMEETAAKARKYGIDINDCIRNFQAKIKSGPIYVCSCCRQTWFLESVSSVGENFCNSHSQYLTNYVSVQDKQWICRTCLSNIKKNKTPKLSVSNGMKWPSKPKELELHPLEERLISLRIPFMQIRELPRGGQYCVKGNVVNVPVDIQPTINVLPRQMDQEFTIPVKLKKKLSYKKCDFTENVRPKAVLSALHWLLSGSDLYRNSGVQVDESWIQTISNDSRDVVREFLSNSREKNTDSDSTEATESVVAGGQDESAFHRITPSSRTAEENQTDVKETGYESDNFSEVDAAENVSGNADTLLEDVSINTDRSYTFAPGENQHPLSLYTDKDAEYLSFPSLFCGQRRTDNKDREVPVHYTDIAKWELRSEDRRAAQSVPNIFFKLKKIQMKQISDKVHLAVRRYKTKGKKITAAEARDQSTLDRIVRLDEGYYIFRQLRNSPAYLASRKKDVFAMIRQLGLPTWFMSLSSADTRWTDLLKALARLNDGTMLSDKDVDEMTWSQKSKLIQKDPVTCSRFFDHRVQQFITNFLRSPHHPVGKLTDFFYRVEFQQRGSPHIHMLVWVENAPKYPKDSEENIVEYVDKYTTCSNQNDNMKELVNLQTHKHSKTCRKQGKAICRFGFPLPPLKQTMILEPLDADVDKYKKKYDQMQEKINQYKEGLSLSYDHFLQEVVQMKEEEYIKCIRSSLNGPKLFLKRQPSEMRINLYNEHLLLAWNANIDMQFVLDPYACAMYIVSYISKSQRGMSALLDRACKEARQGNMDIKKQVRHIGNKFLNSVEVSAQEACYLVLQMPLTKASRDVIFINTSPPNERVLLLKQQSKLEELNPDSTDIHCQNIIERYSKRPRALENWCLADYASQLDIKYPDQENQAHPEEENEDDQGYEDDQDDNTEFSLDEPLVTLKNGIVIRKRLHDLILRYVRYSLKNDPENYYRERLLLFMSWRDECVDLLNGCSSYKDHYDKKRYIIDNKAKKYEQNFEEIEQAMQAAEEECAQHDELAPNAQQINADDESEGQREAEQYVHFNPDRPIEHRHYDIGADIGASTSAPNVECHSERIPDNEYLSLARSLNIKQREFFNHVLQWIKTKNEPIYAFLSGGAGVGKSVLIKALYQALHRHLHSTEGEDPDDTRILLCAFTGKAAYNINGVTIASAFHKKYNQLNQSMTSDELNTFRMKYRNLSVIIIDEISMVGNKMLNFIDSRLKQLTATNKPFGGISILAVGDLYQLQPVGDSWIFNDLSDGPQILATNLWKEHFSIFEMTEIMRQKDDLHFADLLNRLRTNDLTEEDKAEIRKHIVSPAEEDYPKDVPHLFVENKFVDSFNQEFIQKLPSAKVTVGSHDAIIADIPKANKERLVKNLPKDSSKTANLSHSLTLAVGMIYDITVNLDVSDGIANGSTCIVKYIENRIPTTTRPSIVWVLFNDISIGSNTRQKYKHLYHRNIDRSWTPVFDVNRNFMYNYKSYQRTQFPLKPAAAKTVHKAQGCTVDKIVIDLSQTRTRKTPHIHYVAMSRARKLENLKILNFNEDALAVDDRVKAEMARLRKDAVMALCFVPLYTVESNRFKVALNNARSFNKHFQDVSRDPNMLAANVIGITESRLSAVDEDANYLIEGFNIVRNDQEVHNSNRRPCHGLVMYINLETEYNRVVKHTSCTLEFLLCDIHHTTVGWIQVVLIYKSPVCTLFEFKENITDYLEPHIDSRIPFVIMGDFNFDITSGNSEFLRFMTETFQCNQHVNKTTTNMGSILDLVFSNLDMCTEAVECYWSDHKVITAYI